MLIEPGGIHGSTARFREDPAWAMPFVPLLIIVGLAGALGGALVIAGIVSDRLALAVVAGAVVVAGSIHSLEIGLAILLALVGLFTRSDLFAANIPLGGGSLKPTDLLLLCVVGGWVTRLLFRRERMRRPPLAASVFVLGFVVWAALSAMIAMSRGTFYKDALLELRPLLQYALFLPMVTELDARRVLRLIWTILAASTVVASKAVALYMMGVGATAAYTGGGIRVMAIEFWFMLAALLLGVAVFGSDVRRGRYIALVVAVLNLGGLVVTFYRSAFLGLAVALLFLFLISSAPSRRRFLSLGLVGGGVAATAITLASLAAPKPVQHFAEAFVGRLSSIAEYGEDVSAQHRFREWRAAYAMISDHPIGGNGLGARVGFYSPMYSPSEQKASMGYWSNDIYMHNSYMWMLTKMGVIGFGLFALIVVASLVTAIRTIRAMLPTPAPPALTGLATCIVALAVISFFGPMFNDANAASMAAFAIGGTFAVSTDLRMRYSRHTHAESVRMAGAS